MKITQLYGSEDFMDRKFADKLKEEGYMSKECKIITISKSGHHLYTDNAPEVIQKIVESVNWIFIWKLSNHIQSFLIILFLSLLGIRVPLTRI